MQNRPELNAWGNPLEDGKNYMANPDLVVPAARRTSRPGVTKAQALAQLQPVFQHAAYVGLGYADAG